MKNRKRTWREAGVTIEQIHARCSDDCDCLLWTGAHNHAGQPKIRNTSARRIVWELASGPIPAGALVTTSCGHPGCLRPEHLELTNKALVAVAAAKRSDVLLRKSVANARAARASTRASITEAIAREIRASSEMGVTLAERYGVSPSLVTLVRKNKAWKDYSNPWQGLMR